LDVVVCAIDGRRAVVCVLALIALLAGAWIAVLLFLLSLLLLAGRADDATRSWEDVGQRD
jgi:hypothetical protein